MLCKEDSKICISCDNLAKNTSAEILETFAGAEPSEEDDNLEQIFEFGGFSLVLAFPELDHVSTTSSDYSNFQQFR